MQFSSIILKVYSLAILIAISFTNASLADVLPYNITDLGGVPGHFGTSANAINDSGQIVGHIANQAFLYSNSTLTYLGTLGGTYSEAYGINECGQIVGYSQASAGNSHAFLWTPGGTDGVPSNRQMKDLGTLTGQWSYVRDINDQGQVVGDWNTGAPLPFIWDNINGMQDLSSDIVVYSNGGYSNGWAINNNSDVVGGGHVAWLWHNGNVAGFDPVYGNYSLAHDINDHGQIVGYGGNTQNDSYTAHLWEGEDVIDLDPLSNDTSQAQAINNCGIAVGFRAEQVGPWEHAFLFTENAAYDLNDLIPADSGWCLNQALDVNDAGQIVGYGTIDGVRHAYLLTPIPEPATLSLLALSGLAVMRRRRR